MQTITVGEFGISYLSECIKEYFTNCGYLVLLLLAIMFLVIKSSKERKQIIIPPLVVLLLTIFNPVVPVVMNHIFDVNKEYYRFFWIMPVVIVIATFCTEALSVQKGKMKIVMAVLLCLALVFMGKFVYADGYIKSPNIYKMPEELLQISKIIHEDSESEYPRAIFEYEYEMSIRQYDPKILLTIGRDEYIQAIRGYVTMDDVFDDAHPYNKVLAVVPLGLPVEDELFLQGLLQTNTRYVVITTDERILCPYLEHCGLRLVGKTLTHSVYCYDSDEITDWQLPDYSDVWENY